jgi:hypothetical protein
MSFIIYPQEDNKLAVVCPSGEIPIEEVAAKDVPEGKPYAIVESLDIDNDFFDAYEFQDGEAVVNMEKAAAIHRERWRVARAPKLAALDIAYMKAMEAMATMEMQEIASQKQELRDITKLQLPDTLPELKAFWPEILNT